MAVRTKRIEMRADPESEARIARAAALQHTSVSAFVLGAANKAADDVLSQADQTVMPAEQFDALIASLDVAEPAPQLRKVARRKPAFDRA